ncbi:MAG: carbohydrate-binding domain-containing protein [Lachnospiraceae bacterium]|nr:carbohydrate-binding domain-containing protein [Lachnospiraceae bacterium]
MYSRRKYLSNNIRKLFCGVLGLAVLCTACSGPGSGAGSTDVAESLTSSDEAGTEESLEESGGYSSGKENGASTTEGINVRLTGKYSEKAMDSEFDIREAKAVISFGGSEISMTGEGAEIDGSVVYVREKGTYILSGTLNEGQIIVENQDDENIRLVLMGTEISCSTAAPIYAEDAKNLYITLAKGMMNRITDTRDTIVDEEEEAESQEAVLLNDGDQEETEQDAMEDEEKDPGELEGDLLSKAAAADGAIFSRCDLFINGSGSLELKSSGNDGIKTRDDLRIISGYINVEAADDGIVGKDSVQILDGSIQVTCGDEAISSTEDEDSEKGFLVIDGGEFSLASEAGHGLKSVFALVINDGKIHITKSKEGMQSLNIVQNGGQVDIAASDDGINVSDKRAGATSSDDMGGPGGGGGMGGPSASGNGFGGPGGMGGGEAMQMPDGSQGGMDRSSMSGNGFSGPGAMGGTEAMQMPEGGQGGMDRSSMSGNGFGRRGDRTASGNGGGMGGPGGGGGMGGGFENIDAALVINGGDLTVDAEGDGLDSNGDILINGGTIHVFGPTGDGDTAIDKNGVWEQNGGTLYAQGSSGMVEEVDSDLSDGFYVSTIFDNSVPGGTDIIVSDETGKEILSFTGQKEVPFVFLSSDLLEEGKTYIITAGDQTAEVVEGEMATGGMGGPGGGMGGPGGGMGGQGAGMSGQGAGMEAPSGNE